MAEDSGIGGLLKGSTGPLPNWAWGLVIVGGAAAAYFLPKFLGGTTGQATPTTGASTNQSGLGLAMDPATGLPYAIEGLVPSSSATAGGYNGAVPTQPTWPGGTTQTRATGPLMTPQGGTLFPAGTNFQNTASGFMVNGQPLIANSSNPNGLYFGVPNLFQRSGNWYYAPNRQNQAYPVVSGQGTQFTIVPGIPVPPTYHP